MGTPNARGLTSLRHWMHPSWNMAHIIDAPWNGSYGIVYKYTYVSIKNMYVCTYVKTFIEIYMMYHSYIYVHKTYL